MPKSRIQKHYYDTACLGKKRHDSREAAVTAMRHTKTLQPRLEPYRCKYCQGWHVGNNTMERRK